MGIGMPFLKKIALSMVVLIAVLPSFGLLAGPENITALIMNQTRLTSNSSANLNSGNSSANSSEIIIPPDFISDMKNVTAIHGRDAVFHCFIDHLKGHKVAWMKVGSKIVLAMGHFVIIPDKRLEVQHPDEDTWILKIKNVNWDDRGPYMCQINTIPARSKVAMLTVVVPPEIIDAESSNDLMVPEGANVKLTCTAVGYPLPTITWRRANGESFNIVRNKELYDKKRYSDKLMQVKGNDLQLIEVRRSDMGSYLCIASNSVPPVISKKIELQVNSFYNKEVTIDPVEIETNETSEEFSHSETIRKINLDVKFSPTMSVEDTLVALDGNTRKATLTCIVEANPAPLLFWTKERTIENHECVNGEHCNNDGGPPLGVAHDIRKLHSIKKYRRCIEMGFCKFGLYDHVYESARTLHRRKRNVINLLSQACGNTSKCYDESLAAGDLLSYSPRFQMITTPINNYTYNMTLVIHNFTESDFGRFRCYSSNSVGYTYTAILVYANTIMTEMISYKPVIQVINAKRSSE